MNYSEFKAAVEEKIAINQIFEEDGDASYMVKVHEQQRRYWRHDPEIDKRNKAVDERGWIGAITRESGADGGNCWGGTPKSFSREIRKPYAYLDEVLAAVAPNISFLNYRRLPIKEGFYEDREYYGNYTEYRFEYVFLDELYNYLVEIGEINS